MPSASQSIVAPQIAAPRIAAPRTVKIRGEQLTRLWRSVSMSQETFAAHIGMKRSGLFRLLRPGVHAMFSDNFNRLARGLNMTPHQLKQEIGVGEFNTIDIGANEIEANEPVSGLRGPAQRLIEVPLYDSISAGVRRANCPGTGHGQAPPGCGEFVVRVDGVSMTPDYPHKSLAIFKSVEGQDFVFGKDYLVWFTNGECYFSRVFESDEDRDMLVLRKVNGDRQGFPDRRVHRRDVQRIARCVGVMIDRS